MEITTGNNTQLVQSSDKLRRMISGSAEKHSLTVCSNRQKPEKSPMAEIIKAEYSSAEEFLTAYNPDMQFELLRDPAKAYDGPSPTVADVVAVFGRETAQAWVIPELIDIAECAGVKDKFTDKQMMHLAVMIEARYHSLKLTELLLFFGKLKAGDYGKFYGQCDMMMVAEALGEFNKTFSTGWRFKNDTGNSVPISKENFEAQRSGKAAHCLYWDKTPPKVPYSQFIKQIYEKDNQNQKAS